MKHTPGPWRSTKGYSHYRIVDSAGTDVARLLNPVCNPARTELDARLISAAPDLLSACEAMLKTCGGSENWNGETHEALKLIESAISKARGDQ